MLTANIILDSMLRHFFCRNQIANFQMNQTVEPKFASYIDAKRNCSFNNSEIASISEVKKYWTYVDKHGLDSRVCRNSFWTSNKPLNNTHMVTGNEIEKIDFEIVMNPDIVFNAMKKIPVASFETLQLRADVNEYHLCICVLYEVRKVHDILYKFCRRRYDIYKLSL